MKISLGILILLFSSLLCKAQNSDVKDISIKARPPAFAYIKFCNLKGGPVTLASLLACDSFSIGPDNSLLVRKYYRIKEFSMSVKTHGKAGKVIHLKTKGNRLSADMKAVLTSQIAIEDVVLFYDFVIKGPSEDLYMFGPSFFIVTPGAVE